MAQGKGTIRILPQYVLYMYVLLTKSFTVANKIIKAHSHMHATSWVAMLYTLQYSCPFKSKLKFLVISKKKVNIFIQTKQIENNFHEKGSKLTLKY